jgi:hypothetical protein
MPSEQRPSAPQSNPARGRDAQAHKGISALARLWSMVADAADILQSAGSRFYTVCEDFKRYQYCPIFSPQPLDLVPPLVEIFGFDVCPTASAVAGFICQCENVLNDVIHRSSLVSLVNSDQSAKACLSGDY